MTGVQTCALPIFFIVLSNFLLFPSHDIIDKNGNIEKVRYDELGIILNYFDLEEKKEFILDNSKFTLKEHLKIREDLLKIIHNTDIASKGLDNFTVKDWKTLNKTKKYLKNLFKKRL